METRLEGIVSGISALVLVSFVSSCAVLTAGRDGRAGSEEQMKEDAATLSPVDAGWELVWQDEFAEGGLDEGKWSRCKRGRPNWRDTMSDDLRLLVIDEGVLHLRGIENDDTGSDPAPFLTAGVTSEGKFSIRYAKVQIRARVKSAQGAWPALWMMPETRPRVGYGEIDIMEHLNFDDKVYQTVHSDYTKEDRDRPPILIAMPGIPMASSGMRTESSSP